VEPFVAATQGPLYFVIPQSFLPYDGEFFCELNLKCTSPRLDEIVTDYVYQGVAGGVGVERYG
jgi:hypothetical protein